MSSDDGERVGYTLRKREQRPAIRYKANRRVSTSEHCTPTGNIATAILIPFAIVTLLVGVAVVFGGGLGVKRIGLSGALHTSKPLIMAHRGVRREHPENSWAAFNAARESGFEAVEIDVKRSADGHFYLFHDRNSTELLGVDIDLDRQRLEELQRFPLHHEGLHTTQRILSLEAFADEFADDFVVFLDIKRHGDNNLQRLSTDIAGFIERHDLQKRAIVGGDFLFTAWFEYRFPELYTSVGGPGDFRARAYLWIPTRLRPDFMIARADEITPSLVSWLHENDLIDRWIVHGVNVSNRERVEKWGFSKLLVD